MPGPKKEIKSFIAIIGIISFIFVGLLNIVYGDARSGVYCGPLDQGGWKPGCIPRAESLGLPPSGVESPTALVQIVDSVLVVTYVVALCLAILFIIFAAINYLGAAGDTEKVKTAHKQIVYALIAIAVTLMAVGATQIVQSLIE